LLVSGDSFTQRIMAEAELPLNEFSVAELLATAAGVASALEDNVNFPAPAPSPQELEALTSELATADALYREERNRANDARAKRDQIAEKLRRALTKEVAYVQEASGGDVAKILSANLHVEETTSFWPFSSLGQVEELSASVGDQPGEIDLTWDPVGGAQGYEIEVAYDLTGEGEWEQSGATINSRITLEKLDNRTRYWFRVRAVGDRGAGDWSDPAMKFAP
jgi:hypothetical protein